MVVGGVGRRECGGEARARRGSKSERVPKGGECGEEASPRRLREVAWLDQLRGGLVGSIERWLGGGSTSDRGASQTYSGLMVATHDPEIAMFAKPEQERELTVQSF